jgi:nucleoside-diphosphate-sugar epimerase
VPGRIASRTRTSVGAALRGKSLLLIGATGFLGKVIIERLLRAAPGIEQIYLVIRAAEQSAAARFETEVLASGAFAALAREHGDRWPAFARARLTPIAGDVSQPRLALAGDVYEALTSCVDFVINCAALVTFDAPIDEALRHNTRSAQHVAELARACRSAALVHISTAFVAGRRRGRIAEGALSVSPAELDEVAGIVAAILDEGDRRAWDAREVRGRLVEAGMTRAKARGWHDSYTYTKALGETMVERHRGAVPTAIVRPTIIESSLRDPAPGWLENLNVGDPIIVDFGRGRMPDFPLGLKTVFDIVPVDLVANAVVAVLPRVAASGDRVGYYTIGSGAVNPLTGARLYELTYQYFSRHPMRDRRGRAIVPRQWTFPTPERFREMFADERRSTALKRLMYLADLYEGYANADSVFDTANIQPVLDDLDAGDRALLDFDVRRIEWRSYIQDVHIPGLKRHILGEATPSRQNVGVHA